MKIILGFCGRIASGKGTACQYLQAQKPTEIVMFSQSLRDVLQRLHLEINRENIQKISKVLRENFSQDILAKVVSYDANQSSAELVLVDGVRRPQDIEYLKALPNFYLLSINAEQTLRWQRLKLRRQNQDDQEKTLEQFKIEDEAESESLIDEVAKSADYQLDNNGNLENLYQQLDAIINKIKTD